MDSIHVYQRNAINEVLLLKSVKCGVYRVRLCCEVSVFCGI